MSEPREFFETGKTYTLNWQDGDTSKRFVFRCFGATVVPEGAIGAGGRIAAGYQSGPDTLATWDLTLFGEGAWDEGWTEADLEEPKT